YSPPMSLGKLAIIRAVLDHREMHHALTSRTALGQRSLLSSQAGFSSLHGAATITRCGTICSTGRLAIRSLGRRSNNRTITATFLFGLLATLAAGQQSGLQDT